MNARIHTFDVAVEGQQVDEVVASIFHTVLLYRTLGKLHFVEGAKKCSMGTIGFKDVDCKFFDFSYVCCSSTELDRSLKRGISLFSMDMRRYNGAESGQISLEFYQKKRNRWPFNSEYIPWEIWTVHVEVVRLKNEDQRIQFRENLESELSEKVLEIAKIMNHDDYLPSIPDQSELDSTFVNSYTDVQPYLFKISYTTSNIQYPSKSVMSSTVRKILKDTLTF